MRILFAGSPAIAIPALEVVVLLAARGDCELAGLLTKPDSRKGRGNTSEPSDLAAAAQRLSEQGKAPVPILKPEKLDGFAREQATALRPDLLVSFAYGRIFGPKFLALFSLGGINIHPSLLPQYRGPAPIPAAILQREKETGISIQTLAPEMDSGDILAQETIALDGRETTGSLSVLMAQKAAELLPGVLKGLANGTVRRQPQNHGEASFCSLLVKEAGLIDWNKSALEIDARIRAFDPWPQSWTFHNGEQLFILKAEPADPVPGTVLVTSTGRNEVEGGPPLVPGRVLGMDKRRGILIQTGAGTLLVRELQYRAKKALEWRAFINGARNFIGAQLG